MLPVGFLVRESFVAALAVDLWGMLVVEVLFHARGINEDILETRLVGLTVQLPERAG